MTDAEKKVREEAEKYASKEWGCALFDNRYANEITTSVEDYIAGALPREMRIEDLDDQLETAKAEYLRLLGEKESWGNEFSAVIMAKEERDHWKKAFESRTPEHIWKAELTALRSAAQVAADELLFYHNEAGCGYETPGVALGCSTCRALEALSTAGVTPKSK